MSRVSATKFFKFEAAHYLPGYDGPCGKLHGHSYKLEVETGSKGIFFISAVDDPYIDAMVIDFRDLKDVVRMVIVDRLDHTNLNDLDIEGFPGYMPTAENMVVWIAESLDTHFMDDQTVQIIRVRLWETSTSYVEIFLP